MTGSTEHRTYVYVSVLHYMLFRVLLTSCSTNGQSAYKFSTTLDYTSVDMSPDSSKWTNVVSLSDEVYQHKSVSKNMQYRKVLDTDDLTGVIEPIDTIVQLECISIYNTNYIGDNNYYYYSFYTKNAPYNYITLYNYGQKQFNRGETMYLLTYKASLTPLKEIK